MLSTVLNSSAGAPVVRIAVAEALRERVRGDLQLRDLCTSKTGMQIAKLEYSILDDICVCQQRSSVLRRATMSKRAPRESAHAVVLVGGDGEEFGLGEDDCARERVARREARAPVGDARPGARAGARRDEHHVEARLVAVHTVQDDLQAAQYSVHIWGRKY